ncbi:hypothetical protein JKP88DRAFT_339122 [Tribonema minus]|uniref:NAD(P)-binding domain-containing protein n=1 Tax=Tribonema minus TaxID=303371 RepID=A0A835YK07_9STRA|nr:hypothetical protein JKP88DRAFT_339122 [Tribonema minus]
MARHVRLPALLALLHLAQLVPLYSSLRLGSFAGTPVLATCRSGTSAACSYVVMSSDDGHQSYSPEEWEARRKLAGALGGGGLDKSLGPIGSPLDPKSRSWEQEVEDLSNAELARKLAAAKANTKGVERKAIQKIVSNYFEEGAEEFLKSAERIVSDGFRGWEDSAAARSAATQTELLSDIDRKIGALMAQRRDVTAPLDGSAQDGGTPGQRIAADLEALLAGPPAVSTEEEVSEPQASPYGGAEAFVPDTMLDQGPVTSLQKGTVLKEQVVRTRADSGRVIVVGADGPLGEAVLSRLLRSQQAAGAPEGSAAVAAAAFAPLEEAPLGEAVLSRLLRSQQASGFSLEEVRKGLRADDTGALLKSAGTIIIAPDKDAGGNGGAGEWALGGLFGSDKAAVLSDDHVEALLKRCEGGALKHVVCLSAIGANRAGQFPFSVQNVGGKLDAARAVEQAVMRRSKRDGFDYTILRVGRLCAEPAGKPGVELEPGDALQGDTSRPIAEEALIQALTQSPARNATASIVSAAAAAPPTQALWTDLFLKMQGPEQLLRVPLADVMPKDRVDVTAAAIFMREWAQLWTRAGSGLTTPVTVATSPRAPNGSERVEILFRPTANAFVSSKEERAAERARDKGEGGGGGGGARRGAHEGGVIFLVEALPYPRIRVVRAPLSDGAALKEMSESAIVSRFQRDAAAAARSQFGAALCGVRSSPVAAPLAVVARRRCARALGKDAPACGWQDCREDSSALAVW